jgi:hypothetical protein
LAPSTCGCLDAIDSSCVSYFFLAAVFCCCLQESQIASLLDVAQGMAYLHGSSIVHGDLKAANVCYVKAAAPGCSDSKRQAINNRLVCKVGACSLHCRVGQWPYFGK